jgi:hypothetical protein
MRMVTLKVTGLERIKTKKACNICEVPGRQKALNRMPMDFSFFPDSSGN